MSSPDKPPTSDTGPAQPSDSEESPGGPLMRAQLFMQERATHGAPSERAAPSLRAAPTLAAAEAAETAPAEPEPTDLASQRLDQLRQFRQRTRQQLAATDRERRALPGMSPTLAAAEAAPPPEPPQPAPANNWIPIGPAGVRQGQAGTRPLTSGRTTGIAVAPGGQRVYIASANGGVWRSDDAGESWRSMMDAFDLNPLASQSDSLACGAIAIDPTNPDRVFVGSGEGQGAAYFGVGPVVSPDGGVNWLTEPTVPQGDKLVGRAFYALAVDPLRPDRVVGATTVGAFVRERQSDGNYAWLETNVPRGSGDLRISSVAAAFSGSQTTFYLARWGGGVYASNDGRTWVPVGTGFPGLPGNDVARIGLAVQPHNPNVVYALVSKANGALSGVWRLKRDDNVWREVQNVPATLFGPDPRRGGQGWYDLAITVAPDNENRIYLGGSITYVEIPGGGGDWAAALYRCDVAPVSGGLSMQAASIGFSVHGDVHAIEFAPGDPNKLWVGCDGGVFYSTSPTASGEPIFVSRNAGLQTLTMNNLAHHPTEPALLFCGTQDNGGQRYTGEETWLYAFPGDAGYPVINWRNPNQILMTYTYGTIYRSDVGGPRAANYYYVNVPLAPGEWPRFYAPLVGTPYNPDPARAADADLVAFGSIRPWISWQFGLN